MRRFTHSAKGSVLLEAVITAPLHLMFLMGTLWIGTLSLDRQNLLMLDSAYAFLKPDQVTWETLADADTEFSKKNFLWSSGAVFYDETPSATPQSSWLMLSRSRMQMSTELPEIISCITEIFKLYNSDTGAADRTPGRLTFAAQGSADELDATAVWLRKNPDYEIDRNKTTAWQTIANENFVFGPQMNQTTVLAGIAEYNRDPKLKQWSSAK